MPTDVVDDLVVRIEKTVGTELPQWGGGWPDQVEAALLDAIFSIRARYGGPTNGVRAVVNRWSSHRDGEMNDLAELARAKPAEVAAVVDNRTKASGRLKSEIVVDAANALVAVGPCMQMI